MSKEPCPLCGEMVGGGILGQGESGLHRPNSAFPLLSGWERVKGVSAPEGGDHGLHVAHPEAGLQLPAQLPPACAR